jgi:hypothetical protein
VYEVQGASVAEVQKTAADLSLLDIEPFGNVLHVRVASDGPDAEELRAKLTRHGVHVTGVIDAEVTLEDVFLQVVGGATRPRQAPEQAKAS